MGESQILEVLNKMWIEDGLDNLAQNLVSSYMTNNLSINVANYFSIFGFNAVMPTACSSANYAIGYGYDSIRSGRADLMVCGGVDAFSRVAFTGFNRLYAMAPEKCQPFDRNRKGMMLGEGAAVLVLESLEHAQKRNAKIFADLQGCALSCDAHHMTQPSVEGIASCLEKVLNSAHILREEVDYISAHGTGTPQNDRVECSALRKVFGDFMKNIPCSSIKSMLGHAMGAAAALEAVACCLSIRDGVVPPTINYETPDDECDLACVPNRANENRIETVLNNACAFGGNNASLIFRNVSVC